MSCRCFSMRSLSPARWAYRRRAPMNFCMRTVSHRFGSAAGLSYRRNSSVSGWSDRREAHMKNKYLPARVSRVWRLCPIFRAQPGAYSSGAQKTGVAPPCGSVGGKCSYWQERQWGKSLATNVGTRRNGQNRGILDAAARKRESRTKPRGRARPAAVTSARGAGSFGDLRGGC